ncbi:GNAT family N-acetyltransferase [Nocardioides sp.]|uniref:GNAT family N-acetyltransferase n=1 Tax=Nocardioides sp. TaxID=35761 RepID=UPI0035685F4E
MTPALPSGYTSRPLDMPDAGAVTAVMAAQELYDVGEVVIEEADIVGDWQRPSFDVPDSTIGVFDGDQLVAYAEVANGDRGDAAVHPDHRGRGLGTWLARWMQVRAREKGSPVIGMPAPEGSDGDRLMAALGYHVRWRSWVLQLPPGASVPARPLPEGYSIRAAEPDECRTCWTVVEDAFLEWSVRAREEYDDWAASVVRRPGFDPWNLRVVLDPSGTVVGVAVLQLAGETAYISRLATRRDQRGLGLAQALLVDAFAQGAAHGATVSELSTDSRTGALGLYEKVGMKVTSTWVNRAIQVGAAG